MKYLIEKAAQLVDGLENVEAVRFYPESNTKEIEGYTNDVLVIDFKDELTRVFRYHVVRQQFEII